MVMYAAQLATVLTSGHRVSHHGAYSIPYVADKERLYGQRSIDTISESDHDTTDGGVRVNLSLLSLGTKGSGVPGHHGRGASANQRSGDVLEKVRQRIFDAARQTH